MRLALLLIGLRLLAAGCVPVAAERITMADLARAVPAFASAPGAEVLGFTPTPGLRRLFSAADLERWARRFGLSETRFSAGVCFEWPVEPLSESAVLAALRRGLGDEKAKVELREYSRQPAPKGEIEFIRGGLLPTTRWQPGEALMWKGRVKYTASRSFPIWAKVIIGTTAKRVVAKQNLPAGKGITADQVALEDWERPPFASTDAGQIEQVVGRIPRRSIEAGMPVPLALLSEPKAVEKGERVAVEVRRGAMVLTMDAVAETGARAGERVMLRNPSSGKLFPARIESKGKAVATGSGEQGGKPKV